MTELAPPGFNKVWLCTSGSQANETAIKLARSFHLLKGDGARAQVISRWNSYHGSSLGALAFHKGLGVIHSLAHQLSTQCNIPHGAACGLLIPHAIRFNLKEPGTHRAYKEVAEIFTGREAGAEDAPAAIEGLIQALNVPSRLGDWGVTGADVDVMAPNAMLDHCHPRNPRKCSEDDMRALYRAAM